MRKTLIAFVVLALATLSHWAAAEGVGETFLVLRTESGTLVRLEYSPAEVDEQAGIRRYRTPGDDRNAKATECSLRDAATPRQLRCPVVEGRQATRVYEEIPRPSVPQTAVAGEIYKQFLGNRPPSSIGGLRREMFVCTVGCPEASKSVAIQVTCAGCGMKVNWCYRRQQSRPTLATIVTDEVNLRTDASANSRLAGKLRFNQAISILDAKSECSEIRTKEGVRLGRWIKVRTSDLPQTAEGWLFDIYVQYNTEK